MYILGISAFYHDSAACLIRDGEILAAAQEERFTRKKHDFQKGSFLGPSFSTNQIREYLEDQDIPYQEFTYEEVPDIVAELLSQEKVIGWFQGGWSLGPEHLVPGVLLEMSVLKKCNR